MNYSFSISTKLGDEYRIILLDADISVLGEKVKKAIEKEDLDISEILIDRVRGGESTAQEVLHAITGRRVQTKICLYRNIEVSSSPTSLIPICIVTKCLA